jgi:predicted TIM-barrel fold metal-dependent hydrolase
MKYITVEEHFGSPGFLAGPGRSYKEQMLKASFLGGERLIQQLCEMGTSRIQEMDAAGIDMQILSLNYPGVEQSEPEEAMAIAREANDCLRDAILHHPTRFAGLAALPTGAPEKAVQELQTRVGQKVFKGVIINGHNRGRYLDDPFYWPVLECAESLGIPIYLHPTLPPKGVQDASYSGFSPGVDFLLAGPAWGWHMETAVHVLRMVVGGVFDRFPALQVVIGHMGEGLPFMLPRLNAFLPQAVTKLNRPVGAYLRENLHYTFGSFNYPATFLNLVLEVGFDRILFSVDYPYGSMQESRDFLDKLAASPGDKERIAHLNATRLFKL